MFLLAQGGLFFFFFVLSSLLEEYGDFLFLELEHAPLLGAIDELDDSVWDTELIKLAANGMPSLGSGINSIHDVLRLSIRCSLIILLLKQGDGG